MTKDNALQRIDSHEKLCRIMQKQTHDKIQSLENQITRVERILLVSMGAVITGMGGVILVLLQKLQIQAFKSSPIISDAMLTLLRSDVTIFVSIVSSAIKSIYVIGFS